MKLAMDFVVFLFIYFKYLVHFQTTKQEYTRAAKNKTCKKIFLINFNSRKIINLEEKIHSKLGNLMS